MAGKVEMTKEEIAKSVHEYIDEIFEHETEDETSDLEKSKKTESEKEETEKSKKAKDEKEKEKEKEKKEEKKEESEEDEEDGEDESEEESHKKSYMKDKMYKKGFMNALKCVKEKATKKSIAASNLTPTNNEEDMELKKSLSDLTEQVLSLTKSIAEISKQPAGLRKSVRASDIVKKSNADGKDIDIDETNEDNEKVAKFIKSRNGREKISTILFEEGVKKSILSSKAVAEFEFSGTVADPNERKIVKSLVQEHITNGSLFN